MHKFPAVHAATPSTGGATSRGDPVNQCSRVEEDVARTFGPVPSRRLGRSLGINNIPPKHCSYSCIYCQVGPTSPLQIDREAFYEPEDLAREVERRKHDAEAQNEPIDYLTFVPDGEPTLDINLGRAIDLLRPLGIPVAVISNGSLVSRTDVRDDLCRADWVSLKVDSVDPATWQRTNRAHGSLDLEEILDGMVAFADQFSGRLVTETMLIDEVNDADADIEQIARFLAGLQPATAYLAIPTRPPAEDWVTPPDADKLTRAHQILSEHLDNVEYLIGDEGTHFTGTRDIEEELLAITSVHPMREHQVRELVRKAGADWSTVRGLVERGLLQETRYRGDRFYVRRVTAARR
jgi:wyosine [tRNA(Phe)-imidazoG37] synthetase (radical SAM superfamily)